MVGTSNEAAEDEEPFEWPGDNLSLSWTRPFVAVVATVAVLDKLRPFSDEEEVDDEADEAEEGFVLFSMLAKSFGLGVESAPIELQVWASRANGLFFASN